MNFFDPPKFPEPFKPEPLWQMTTCPDCKNDLVCHDQGECLRPTPETDAAEWDYYEDCTPEDNMIVSADFARNLEHQRNEARQAFVIATDQLVQVQSELRQVREENARLREALEKIERRHCIMGSTGDYRQGQLDALEVTRTIAGLALTQTNALTP